MFAKHLGDEKQRRGVALCTLHGQVQGGLAKIPVTPSGGDFLSQA